MNFDNIIKEAVRQSRKTTYMFRLGAVVFNNDRIISSGYNRVFSKSGYDSQGNCAEVMAIKRAPGALLKDAKILVCRVNECGTFGMSKPCPRCAQLIEKSGISKVIYSTPDGFETIRYKK